MYKTIKKSLLMTIILIIVITTYSFASDNEYKISAIDLKITLPNELNVLTRNVSEGNAALEKLDTNAASLKNNYISNNVYLDAFPDDLSYEIVVTSTKINNSDAKNFIELSDDSFNEYMNNLKDTYEKNPEEELLDSYLYTNNNAKYIVSLSHSNAAKSSVYVLKYYTVMNGYNYNYTLQTNDLIIDNTFIDTMNTIIDSAKYEKVKASITESSLFMEIYEMMTGFLLTVAVLGAILFFLIKASKKR